MERVGAIDNTLKLKRREILTTASLAFFSENGGSRPGDWDWSIGTVFWAFVPRSKLVDGPEFGGVGE